MSPIPALPANLQARILVVEDHPITAKALAREFYNQGSPIEVIGVAGGEQALRQAQNQKTDLVITEMTVSDMTGLELIEKLRMLPESKGTHVILITAYEPTGLKAAAQRLEVDEIIKKPVRIEEIEASVGKILNVIAHAQKLSKPTDKKQPKVLIADDWPDNVTLLSRFLSSDGFLCIKASNGVEAVTKSRSDLPDIILLDINMPQMNGFEALREIRSDPITQNIPVIIITATTSDQVDIDEANKLGISGYITKPFDRRDLLARIRKQLNKG